MYEYIKSVFVPTPNPENITAKAKATYAGLLNNNMNALRHFACTILEHEHDVKDAPFLALDAPNQNSVRHCDASPFS